MNYVDLFLIIIIALSIYSGYLRGFIIGTLQLLMLAAGLIGAFLMYPYVAAFLEKNWASLGVWTIPLAFIFSLIVLRIILSFIVDRYYQPFPQMYMQVRAIRLWELYQV
jgi:uncharacterized membrane protein required for colicin V production